MGNPKSRKGVHFLADAGFIALLERGARATGKSKTAIVRDAVREHVARIETELLARRLDEAYRGLNGINTKLQDELASADAPWPRTSRR